MWGKLNIKIVAGKPTKACIGKDVPKAIYSVESSSDAVKPFNLVYVNTAHSTYKNAYVKNASAYWGDANDSEGDLNIVEPKMVRTEQSEFYDQDTVIPTGKAVEISACVRDKLYLVRPSSLDGTAFLIGDKLVIAANGTVEKLASSPSNPVSTFGHMFVAMENYTFSTTGIKKQLLAKYIGIAPFKIAGS